MELKKVNIIREGAGKVERMRGWEDKVTLDISTKQFPDIKKFGSKTIKMEIEGDVIRVNYDKERDKEDYTILIKKAAIINKKDNEDLSIDEKVKKIKEKK